MKTRRRNNPEEANHQMVKVSGDFWTQPIDIAYEFNNLFSLLKDLAESINIKSFVLLPTNTKEIIVAIAVATQIADSTAALLKAVYFERISCHIRI